MPSLTRAEAALRSELLDVHAYRIDLDLSAAGQSDTFGSTTTIRFSCRRPGPSATFVEVKCAQLHEVTLNGVPIDPAAHTR